MTNWPQEQIYLKKMERDEQKKTLNKKIYIDNHTKNIQTEKTDRKKENLQYDTRK